MRKLLRPYLKEYSLNNKTITGYILYYFPDNCISIRAVTTTMDRHYGIKHNGQRPITAEVVGSISNEFRNKYLKLILHPIKGRII